MSKAATDVNYKSTKADIWQAYRELMASLENQPDSSQTMKKISNATTDIKEKLLAQIETIHQQMLSSVNQLTQDLTQATELLEELNKFRQKQKAEMDQEKQMLLNTRKREEEEYNYEFEKRKRRQVDELKEQKEKADAAIKTREEELQKSETELKNLRDQAATLDKQIETKIKEAVQQTTQELSKNFHHEKLLAEQTAKAKQELLGQKITSLEAELTGERKEIERLHTALTETNKQLSRIAERAVEKPAQLPTSKREE